MFGTYKKFLEVSGRLMLEASKIVPQVIEAISGAGAIESLHRDDIDISPQVIEAISVRRLPKHPFLARLQQDAFMTENGAVDENSELRKTLAWPIILSVYFHALFVYLLLKEIERGTRIPYNRMYKITWKFQDAAVDLVSRMHGIRYADAERLIKITYPKLAEIAQSEGFNTEDKFVHQFADWFCREVLLVKKKSLIDKIATILSSSYHKLDCESLISMIAR